MSVLFGPGDTTGLSPAEVTFDGSTSTVAWPSSSSRAGRPTADGGDVCMPAGVGMATALKDTGYFGKSRDRESVRERFAPSAGGSPVSPTFRGASGGHSLPDAKNQRDPERASPRGQLAASRAQAEQLRDEVAQLHHLLHQTRELHASEASRLHFQLQESKTTARREQGLREEAELREKAKSSQCDQLQKEIGALKQQLTKRHIHIGGSSQGNSPLNSLKGEDLRQLGTELQQIRQDSQELRDLMAKQHDEELQRLREDLEQTQQSSRKAHHAVSKLEAAQKQQSITDQAATRKLEDRCLQLEHYTEIAEAKRMAATEEVRAMEAAHRKLNQEMHQEQAAARQAHTQLERLSLEQKSMILDQALQEEAQERASQLTKRFAASEVQREDLERQLRQERHQLHLVQKQLDATALYHDRAQERISTLEASAKSADLQQAVECASFWTEQDALRRSQRQTAVSEERARQLQFEVKSLEYQQEHARQLQLSVERLESKEEAAEQAQLELKDQHSMAESKVSQLQDAVSFLQQRVTQNAGTDAKLSEIQMMFRKVLNRYKKLLASSADTHISTVTCESKLSEMEMLMRGVEEEQDALISLQEQQQLNLASAEAREKALQSEAAEEMRESIGLRTLLRSAERSHDTILAQLQNQETERVRRSDWLREESEERLASAFQMTERLQQSLDSANEALKTSVQSQHSKDELYTNLLKDYRSLQDEEQRRQRAQDEIQQRLMEEGARVKALEALKHREEETIEHVSQVLKGASEEHQANSLKYQAQIQEMKTGQEQLLEQVKQETDELLSHLHSRDTILAQLQNQETERARRSDWLREESEERLASAFQMTERLQQSLDSANEALKTSVQSQHSKDELYTNLLKDYRSLQDEEQRRQRAQDEIQQRLMEEGARVKALEALKHREEETIEHVSQVLKEASEEHQANSLKYQAQIQEMKTGQEQLLEQVKQETNEQLSHLYETNRSMSAECHELLTASREADEMHQGNVQRMQKNLDEMKGHCVSCENVADSMRKHAETLTAHLRLAQDEVKARLVMLAHTEEQAAFQRQQHLLERKELEDEYAKQAWQADKNELKIQEMMAESSNTAAETVSRIARSQEKEAKAAARAEQLEVILRELRATLAHSQEESTESSKQVLSLEKAHSDFQEKLAENRKITADLETQIHDLEDQLKLCSTELHESEARHLQQQQQQISQERSRQQTQEMRMEQMQRQCQMSQVQVSEAHDALQAKEKEIRHLEKLQEEDHKRHSSLSSLRDQLDFNCRELNHQIQQLNAVNKEEQKKSTAIELRLEQVEAEAQYASSEAVQAARQQEFAFETLMARCSASEHSVQQLEETRKQLRAQLAAQSRLRESERYAEQVVAATLGPAEAPDSDAVRRNLEAKGLELTELEFTLREVELNSDRLQQYLEQSQSNLEMQTEEKIRLEDHYAASRRQLMDTEAKLREVQGQCSYWKSQHQSEEQRAQQWETKVEDLLRDLQCLQSELAKVQGLPPTEAVLPSRDAREIRQLQQELQLVSGQAKEQAQQLEHGRSVQQNLMAARAQLDEGYREAQERLAQAEEELDELRAQGNSARRSEARHYQEELLALRTAQATMEAQSQARERSAEERVQKFTMDLRHLSQKNSNLLEENQDRKAAALNLEDSIKRLRTDVDHMSTARKEEGEMFMHQEDATRHLEIALEMQTQRTEELFSENSNLHSEIEQLERRCRGQEEKSAQTLQGALSIEKQLLAVRAKHGQLQEAYREQRHLRAKEAEDGRASTKGIVDALKEELSQLREEAAAERAVREETDRIQEEVEEKVRRLHSEELQGIHFEHNALRSALHLQRRNSTAALEAQRWALRREKQLRKKRYALLMAASEELRGGLMRLKEATESAAVADASVEDQDQQVAEELEQVKLDQQVLSDSRAVEQEKMAHLDEVQLQLKDERKAATPNQLRIQELLVAERLALEEVEKQEAVVAEDKQHFNEDYKKLEEAHAEERCSRERAEAYHHQVAAETQLLAVDLLKLQGVFEADGESESNFSQGSKGVREGRPLLGVASSEDEEEGSEPGEDGHVHADP